MKTYLRILSYARPYRKFLPIYGIVILLHVVFDIFSFTLLIPLLNIIFKENTTSILSKNTIGIDFLDQIKDYFNTSFHQVVVQYGAVGALAFVCLALLGTNFLTNLFFYVSQRIIAGTRSKMILKLREDLYSKIVHLDIGYFTNEKRGDLISRITNDVQEIERTIIGSVRVVLRDPFKIIVIFVYLFTMEIRLTLFCLGVMPFAAISIVMISKKLKKLANKSQSILGEILEIVNETIGGIRIVKAFNKSRFTQNKFDEVNTKYATVLKKMAYKKDLASPLSQFVSISFIGLILFYGGYLVLTNNSTVGLSPSEFLTFIIIFARILEPAKAIASAVSETQRGIISGKRIFEVIDTQEKIVEDPKAVSIQQFTNNIVFKNFSFAYENIPVLKSINLQIKKGTAVALVGPSGGGKSTLMDMVPRFYDPQEGNISIDGIDSKKLKLEDLRELMGIVTQEAVLFNDTIYNNIAFGIDCTESDVIEAAKVANAHEFIKQMDKGYLTEVGDRGTRLSGGQRQRITIARAILKNPPILLLDEATSALDSESELLVQEALNNLMKNRTSLIIAHRLSTIQNVDEIIVLESGEIIEKGNHEELLRKEGVYYRLQKIQQG